MTTVETEDELIENKKRLKRERNKRYREKNREKVLAAKREYDSKDEIKERKKKYREEKKSIFHSGRRSGTKEIKIGFWRGLRKEPLEMSNVERSI